MKKPWLKVDATWTPDCSGKQDFYGPMVSVSTRYWPAGGGYYVSTGPGDFRLSANGKPPSAHSSIVLDVADTYYVTLAEANFEAETESQVKAQVEHWVAEQLNIVARTMAKRFRKSWSELKPD